MLEPTSPQIPSLGPRVPRVVTKPWGQEVIYAETPRYVGKILVIGRGQRLSLQYHERKHETLYVLRGRVQFSLGASVDALETVVLQPGEALELAPGTVHTAEAIEDSEILEVSSPEVDDVVRLTDDYGREGTQAP